MPVSKKRPPLKTRPKAKRWYVPSSLLHVYVSVICVIALSVLGFTGYWYYSTSRVVSQVTIPEFVPYQTATPLIKTPTASDFISSYGSFQMDAVTPEVLKEMKVDENYQIFSVIKSHDQKKILYSACGYESGNGGWIVKSRILYPATGAISDLLTTNVVEDGQSIKLVPVSWSANDQKIVLLNIAAENQELVSKYFTLNADQPKVEPQSLAGWLSEFVSGDRIVSVTDGATLPKLCSGGGCSWLNRGKIVIKNIETGREQTLLEKPYRMYAIEPQSDQDVREKVIRYSAAIYPVGCEKTPPCESTKTVEGLKLNLP